MAPALVHPWVLSMETLCRTFPMISLSSFRPFEISCCARMEDSWGIILRFPHFCYVSATSGACAVLGESCFSTSWKAALFPTLVLWIPCFLSLRRDRFAHFLGSCLETERGNVEPPCRYLDPRRAQRDRCQTILPVTDRSSRKKCTNHTRSKSSRPSHPRGCAFRGGCHLDRQQQQ
jgi:hypothetical protein